MIAAAQDSDSIRAFVVDAATGALREMQRIDGIRLPVNLLFV